MACTYLKLKPLWNPSLTRSLAGVRGHDRRDGVDDVRGGVRGERGARAAAGGPQDGAQQEEGQEGIGVPEGLSPGSVSVSEKVGISA